MHLQNLSVEYSDVKGISKLEIVIFVICITKLEACVEYSPRLISFALISIKYILPVLTLLRSALQFSS